MEVMKKLTDEEYNNLYVTSDTHFYHNQEFVWKRRGYENPEQMTEDMINNINNVVGENGILLHLGDFCLNTSTEMYQYIMSKLKVKEIWMLWGNHNNPIQKNYGGTVTQLAASVCGTFVKYLGHYFTFRKGRRMYVCFHFPISIFDNMSYGAAHLCGHSHGSYQLSRPEDKTHKILDCGWDIHRKPLTMKEIEDIIDSKHIGSKHHS
jgi:calcineurin-like phosphoesterase family protein